MRVTARLCLGVFLATLLGCGGGRADLAGTVTYKGAAVKSGSVSVVGSDGLPKTAAIVDGRYEVKGVPAGAVKLAVSSPDPVKSRPRSRNKDEPPPKVSADGWFPIPDRYADFNTSELATSLAAGPNAFDIDLK